MTSFPLNGVLRFTIFVYASENPPTQKPFQNYFPTCRKISHYNTPCMCRIHTSTFAFRAIGGHSFLTCKYSCLQSAPMLAAAAFCRRHIYGHFLELFLTNSEPYLYSQNYCSYSFAARKRKNPSFYKKYFFWWAIAEVQSRSECVYWWAQRL